jgi:anti-sigma factor RsiW
MFVWPFSGQRAPRAHERDGYNVVSWAGGGTQYLAVSDLESSQLRQFVTLWQETQ